MDITSYLLGKQAGGGGSSTLQNNKEVTVTSNGASTITPDSGYDGIKRVSLTTNVQPNLESKSVTINSNTTTTITPTQGKDGLSSVEVTTNVPGIVPTGTININSNGTHDVTNYASASVNVQPNLQTKTLTIDENGTITVTPDSGYDGIGSIVITTDVGGGIGGIDQFTQLMLHFNTNYTDSSLYERAPSATQNTISYTNSGKFDQAFDLSSNQKGLLSYSALKDIVTDDFTIDFWIYPTSFSASNSGNGRPIMGQYSRNLWNVGWVIYVSQYNGNMKKWGLNYNDETNYFKLVSTSELVENTWQHLAITYKKSTKTACLYVNGTKDAEMVIPAEMVVQGGDNPQTFSIGNWFSNYQYAPLCYIDEVRISNTVRYTENFTPPEAPYSS